MSVRIGRLLGSLGAAGWVLAGCGSTDQTSILLSIAADRIRSPRDIDSLRVEVTAPTSSAAETFPLDEPFPHTLTILPVKAPSSESIQIVLIGFLGPAERIRREAEPIAFQPGIQVPLTVTLNESCLDKDCGDRGCIAGACQGDPCVDPDRTECMDAGPDADAGPFDVGPPDAPDVDLIDPARVVISEVGIAGQYVELYNAGDEAEDLSTFNLFVYDATLGAGAMFDFPEGSGIDPHRYMLLTSDISSEASNADVPSAWAGDVLEASGGEVALRGPYDEAVAWGFASQDAGASPGEGTLKFGACSGALERKARLMSDVTSMAADGEDELCGNGFDTDNNNEDFLCRSSGDPQNTASTETFAACAD